MTDRHDNGHDEFDEWLRRSVEPLLPPPGTYERVRRAARRRRLAKAVSVGAATLVVVVGAVTVPNMIRTGQPIPFRPQNSGSGPVQTPQTTRAATSPTPAPRDSASSHPSNSHTGHVTPTHGRPSHHPPGHSAAPRCHTGDLALRLTGGGGGAGQRYTGLVLTNTASHPCTLYGYVGVGMTGPDGPVSTRLIRDGGASRHITVRPGGSAASSLHWTAVPADDEKPSCAPKPTTIEVTPPDETTQLTASWRYGGLCQHGEMHTVPLVPGTAPPPL